MKEIKAIIDPGLLYRVLEALHAMPHFPGVTVSDANGQGRGEGEGGHYISTGNTLGFNKKVKLEIFCSDSICDNLVAAIVKVASAGPRNHGIISVMDISHVVRLSSGQQEDAAL